ncbi:MAG TPA: HTTM domain-containing protein, partial [Polyangiaceae bacterium]|nr:HTTM domain-containing protein [Polyangiaceae bacterium]
MKGWVREERDAYLLGLLRVLLAALLAFNVWQRFDELAGWGYFGDVFHVPVVPEAWVPSHAAYTVLLWVELAGALLGVLGFFGREGLALAASIGIFLLTCDRLQYHNNRFALLLACLLTSFMPSDRSFLLYRGRRHTLPPEQRLAPTLLRRLFQLQVSAVYLSSGGGKLLDPDWRGGQAMHVRFAEGVAYALSHGAWVPGWYAELMRSPVVASLASKGAISLELFLAVGLWLPRTRALALWVGAIFHLMIQASARVELFSFLMGVCYVAFATPEVRERQVLIDRSQPLGRSVGAVLPWLDSLARFQIRENPNGPEALVVIDRDGTRASGLGAAAALARGLPAAYLFWPPLAVAS